MKKKSLLLLALFAVFLSCKSVPGGTSLNAGSVKIFFTPCENGYLKIEALGKKYSAPAESLELKIPAIGETFAVNGNELTWNDYKIVKIDDGYEKKLIHTVRGAGYVLKSSGDNYEKEG